ncbi:Cyclic di-GMP binding protein precursor [plant metagenome]|uniref:Cyclic di-GMP-binding protein n=1 Tax=plant metagenome TaxID=1297885 RepID=A0A484TI91_9ZZZZ
MIVKPHARPASPFTHTALCALVAALLGAGLAAPLGAAPAPQAQAVATPAGANAPADAAPEQPVPEPTYVIPLKDIGATTTIKLHGVDGSRTLPFNIRSDEVVTHARVKLRYTYSPALLPDLSQLNVLVNDEVAGTIELPRETAGRPQQHTVEIPPELITDFNRLRLQLIGHYTMECEDPLHSSLWTTVSNLSTLEMTVTPIGLVNDLAILPRPFFDRRDMHPLEVPIVFGATPDNGTLEAAGVVSSWLGALAGYRKATFPASVADLPQSGHAIVLAIGSAMADTLGLPAASGPTLTMLPNPNDPNGKLLVLSGRDAGEVKVAATALATASQTLTGPSASVGNLAEQAPRQPYDAPRWVRSDRPTTFGELIAAQEDLNVTGYNPETINLDLRVPPDLFGWHAKPVPVDLKYRYTPQPTSVNSSLLVSVSDQYLQSMPLLPIERLVNPEVWQSRVQDEMLPLRADVDIPLDKLLGRSQLQLRYMYDYIKQGECRDIIIDNTRGAIEPESTIDISAYPHFMAMPDLRAFEQLGFPFTRLADLAETAVVLPNNAGAAEYSAYLALMGHVGEATGYPATRVTVARADQVDSVSNKDLLVIASGDQPLLKNWVQSLPASVSASGKRFKTSDVVYRSLGWRNPDPRLNAAPANGEIAYASTGASAIYAGFESPLQSGRSVVLVAASEPAQLNVALDALFGGEGYERPIQGSLAVIRDKQVDPLVAEHSYYLGQLAFLKRLYWQVSPTLERFPLAAFLFSLLLLVVLAGLLGWGMRRLVRGRKPRG